jgi:hypothetical protein
MDLLMDGGILRSKDGFVNGWGECFIAILQGTFPGSFQDGKTVSKSYAKWEGPDSNDANTLVLPTKLSTDPHG